MTSTFALVMGAVPSASGGLMSVIAGPQAQMFLPLIAILGFMYFAILRPQQRRAKEHAARTAAVKRGDTIILSSGLIGKVVRVEDQEIGLEVAQNVTVKVIKSMIAEVRTRAEPAAANDAKS